MSLKASMSPLPHEVIQARLYPERSWPHKHWTLTLQDQPYYLEVLTQDGDIWFSCQVQGPGTFTVKTSCPPATHLCLTCQAL